MKKKHQVHKGRKLQNKRCFSATEKVNIMWDMAACSLVATKIKQVLHVTENCLIIDKS